MTFHVTEKFGLSFTRFHGHFKFVDKFEFYAILLFIFDSM